MPQFKEQHIPKGQWWSPLTESMAQDLPVNDVLKHPRVVLDPSVVLPEPMPEPDRNPKACALG